MKTAGEDLGKQVKSRDRSHGEQVEEFVWNQLIRYDVHRGLHLRSARRRPAGTLGSFEDTKVTKPTCGSPRQARGKHKTQ